MTSMHLPVFAMHQEPKRSVADKLTHQPTPDMP